MPMGPAPMTTPTSPGLILALVALCMPTDRGSTSAPSSYLPPQGKLAFCCLFPCHSGTHEMWLGILKVNCAGCTTLGRRQPWPLAHAGSSSRFLAYGGVAQNRSLKEGKEKKELVRRRGRRKANAGRTCGTGCTCRAGSRGSTGPAHQAPCTHGRQPSQGKKRKKNKESFNFSFFFLHFFYLEIGDGRADLGDNARGLVAQNHRRAQQEWAEVAMLVVVHVRPANADRSGAQGKGGKRFFF
jgi:hypothetical protein